MLILDYLRWWYGRGWLGLASRVETRVAGTSEAFSVRILVSTLFSPWRRTIELGDRTIMERTRAAVGNLVSRGVGFTVRLSALVTALILMTIESALGLAIFLIWPFIPLGSVLLILWGNR